MVEGDWVNNGEGAVRVCVCGGGGVEMGSLDWRLVRPVYFGPPIASG